MNFLEKIENDLKRSQRRGYGDKIPVDFRALNELIERFISLESLDRANYNMELTPLRHRLSEVVTAIYLNNGHGLDDVMLTVMDALRPLIMKDHESQARSQDKMPIKNVKKESFRFSNNSRHPWNEGE